MRSTSPNIRVLLLVSQLLLGTPPGTTSGNNVGAGLVLCAGEPTWKRARKSSLDDTSGGVFPAQFTESTRRPLAMRHNVLISLPFLAATCKAVSPNSWRREMPAIAASPKLYELPARSTRCSNHARADFRLNNFSKSWSQSSARACSTERDQTDL